MTNTYQAYKQGYESAKAGEAESANQYVPHGKLGKAWLTGWRQYHLLLIKRAADVDQPCANFKKGRDGKCYNCGFDEESHR